MPGPLARIDSLSRPARVAFVAGGYGLALCAGRAAAWMYDVRASRLPYDTSGGMYAGGQFLTELAAFAVVALPPTLLALWLLRRHAGFWLAVAAGALLFALAGLAGILLGWAVRATPRDAIGIALELLGLAQLLGVPLWTAAFALFAWLAPTRTARRVLHAAIGIELVNGACAAIHWLSARPPS